MKDHTLPFDGGVIHEDAGSFAVEIEPEEVCVVGGKAYIRYDRNQLETLHSLLGAILMDWSVREEDANRGKS